MMNIRLEDNFEDVLGKASNGLGLSPADLAERSGVPQSEVHSLLQGNPAPENLRRVAAPLGLEPERLVRLAERRRYPQVEPVRGLECFNSPHPIPGYEEMTVNSYLLWDEHSREGVIFDAGASADAMIADIRTKGLTIRGLFLTHTHGDHVLAFGDLMEAAGNPPAYAPAEEPYANARPVGEGAVFEEGALRIEARLTNGHSPGGTTYLVDGLAVKIAIVGDSLFCLSQGGAPGAYERALANNREKILSLPPETIVCPGHGPVSTVGHEAAHNPFFPA